MAVTANQIIKASGYKERRKVPVAANAVIYEGTLVYEDAGGDAGAAIVDENTNFLGIACNYVDNTGGADGDKVLEVYVTGNFLLPLDTTSLAKADLGKTVCGVDNYVVSETATDRPQVGIITEFVSTSSAYVEIKGLGFGFLSAVVTS